MPRSETMLTVAQVLELAPGDQENATWVNPGFTAVVDSIERIEKGKLRWNCVFVDESSPEIAIHSTLFTAPKFSEGDRIEMSGKGLRRTEYKGTQQVTPGRDTMVHVLSGAAPKTGAQVVRHQAPTDTHPDLEPATPPAGTRTQASTPEERAEAAGARPPVFGATVGMAINQANEIMRHIYDPDQLADLIEKPLYSAHLHHLSSDIIRVAQMLEKGQLAPTIRVRCGLAAPVAPAPTVNEHGHTPEQQAKIDRDHAQALAERAAKAVAKAAPKPVTAGDDSDVPF
jgi:hypothetical protein